MSERDDAIAAAQVFFPCQDTATSTSITGSGTIVGGETAATMTRTDGPRTDLPRSFAFNGTDDRIQFTGATSASYSFAAWLKADDAQIPSNGGLFRSGGCGVWVSKSSGKVTFRQAGAETVNGSTGPLLQGQGWMHLGVTFNSATGDHRIFVNGTLFASGTRSAETITLVAFGLQGSEYFFGLAAEIGFWTSAISDAWMTALYTGPITVLRRSFTRSPFISSPFIKAV